MHALSQEFTHPDLLLYKKTCLNSTPKGVLAAEVKLENDPYGAYVFFQNLRMHHARGVDA